MEFLHPLLATHLLVAHPPSHSLVADHPLDEHGQPSRFPTSSDRLGWPIGFPPERRIHSSARYDPLGSLVLEECALARKALCSSFAPRFFPGTVARGVLSDGTWTTEHPSVHVYLQSPSSRPSLTSRTSAAIYSLAALHVFYSPSHPSYDAFWHPDIKASTALFIHQVITMKSSPISTAPMTWLGVNDMLWQLTGIQKEYFKSHGGKTSAPPLVPTRRSLRKRKPVQTLLQELGTREASEVPGPPRKKIRSSKPDENDKGSEATSSLTLEPTDTSTENKAGSSEPPHSKSTMSTPKESRGNADATPSPLTISSSLPPESHTVAKDDVALAGTSRGRSKDAVGRKVQAKPPSSRSSTRRTRERSPSFSSGSSTAVSAAGGNSKRARSSSSASSTSTTVGRETGANAKGKGKEKAADLAGAEEESGEDEEEEAGKRSIRTRRSSAREPQSRPSRKKGGGGATTSRSSAEMNKLAAAETHRKARNRSGVTPSRSRKSRKS